MSLAVWISQPLLGLLSQSAYPEEQVKPQLPVGQVAAAALAGVGQALLQAPQLAGVCRLVSQPSFMVVPLQFA